MNPNLNALPAGLDRDTSSSRRFLRMNYSNPQDLAQQFNDDEAVWRAFECKRWFRNLLGPAFLNSETSLDALDWIEAERESRPVRAIGFSLK